MSNYTEVTGGKPKSYTINYGENIYISQGWQCPICKKVLAPFMTYCPFHNEENSKWSVTSANGKVGE